METERKVKKKWNKPMLINLWVRETEDNFRVPGPDGSNYGS